MSDGMNHPWSIPGSSGENRYMGSPEHCREGIEGHRRAPSELWGGSPLRDVALDLAIEQGACLTIDRYWHRGQPAEHWIYTFNHARLERHVRINVERAHWFEGLAFEISSGAIWIERAEPQSARTLWAVNVEHRWFGTSSRCTEAKFAATLRLAFDDAREYSVDDLDPRVIDASGQRWPSRRSRIDD